MNRPPWAPWPPGTYPLAVGLHVAALEGAVQRVSVELLQQGAAAAEEHVLRTPALATQLLQDLQNTANHITCQSGRSRTTGQTGRQRRTGEKNTFWVF